MRRLLRHLLALCLLVAPLGATRHAMASMPSGTEHGIVATASGAACCKVQQSSAASTCQFDLATMHEASSVVAAANGGYPADCHVTRLRGRSPTQETGPPRAV